MHCSPKHSVKTTDEQCRGAGGAARQAAALRREGVNVTAGNLGELMVDLRTYGWFPSSLPSEVAEATGSEEDEQEHQ